MRVNDSKSSGAGSVLLGIAAIALAGMVGTISLIHQVGELGPKVGDIISFEPNASSSRDMQTRVTAMPADDKRGAACVLDVRTMHATGGSLIIEAHEPSTSFAYRVHWAGPHSSSDSTDCGSAADLLVNLEDLEAMAMAAGGYGVTADKQMSALWRTASAQ